VLADFFAIAKIEHLKQATLYFAVLASLGQILSNKYNSKRTFRSVL